MPASPYAPPPTASVCFRAKESGSRHPMHLYFTHFRVTGTNDADCPFPAAFESSDARPPTAFAAGSGPAAQALEIYCDFPFWLCF